ncbi:MAG: membrane protein insertion efficiency factor YidD [Psittacicella sp.]
MERIKLFVGKIYYIITKFFQLILIGFVKFYQIIISPIIGPRCRYYPTCSHYCVEAIQKHGSIKGTILTFKRFVRCNPLSKGGFDPVPPNNKRDDK